MFQGGDTPPSTIAENFMYLGDKVTSGGWCMVHVTWCTEVPVPPAILIEGHDEALVLDAGDGGVVPVLAGKHLHACSGAVLLLPPDVGVLGPVEPEEGHHHLSCGIEG